MKNLLIISSRYPHANDSTSNVFVYSQVNELKNYFDRVIVISLIPYVPKLLAKMMKPKRLADSLAKDYVYDNVEVYFIKNIVPPVESLKTNRGEQAFNIAQKIINKTGFKPDIVHAHFTWPSGSLAMKIKEEFKVPYVITAHGYDVYDIPFRNNKYNTVIKEVLKNSSHIITVSKNNEKILREKLNVLEKDITIIPNGYDRKNFFQMEMRKAREKLNLPIDKKIILTIGNSQYFKTEDGTVEVKGHKYLYQAAKLIVEELQMKDSVFGIVGEVPGKEIRVEEPMKDNFILFGKKPHSEIPLWVNACDIFVMPSLHEGIPTVLFEALGCGKPFVGTAVGGIPEVINDNKLGILFPPGNIEKLSSAIQEALEIKWDNAYIANAAKKYSWHNIAEQIMYVFKESLQKPKAKISECSNNGYKRGKSQ